LGPDEDRPSSQVPCHGRMLPALPLARCGYRLGALATLPVEARGIHLPPGLPRSKNTVPALGECETAHGAGTHAPVLDLIALEFLSLVLCSDEIRVPVHLVRRRAVQQIYVPVAVAVRPHAATATGAGPLRRGCLLAGKGLALVR